MKLLAGWFVYTAIVNSFNGGFFNKPCCIIIILAQLPSLSLFVLPAISLSCLPV